MDVRVPADAGWGSIAFGTSGMIVSVAAGAVTSLPERTPAAANCLVITGLLPHRNISSGAGRTQGNYGACTRPAPTSVAGSGRCRAVAVSLARNARPRNDGLGPQGGTPGNVRRGHAGPTDGVVQGGPWPRRKDIHARTGDVHFSAAREDRHAQRAVERTDRHNCGRVRRRDCGGD